MTLDEWIVKEGISLWSPEAEYARRAWNAALDESKRLIDEMQKRIDNTKDE